MCGKVPLLCATRCGHQDFNYAHNGVFVRFCIWQFLKFEVVPMAEKQVSFVIMCRQISLLTFCPRDPNLFSFERLLQVLAFEWMSSKKKTSLGGKETIEMTSLYEKRSILATILFFSWIYTGFSAFFFVQSVTVSILVILFWHLSDLEIYTCVWNRGFLKTVCCPVICIQVKIVSTLLKVRTRISKSSFCDRFLLIISLLKVYK